MSLQCHHWASDADACHVWYTLSSGMAHSILKCNKIDHAWYTGDILVSVKMIMDVIRWPPVLGTVDNSLLILMLTLQASVTLSLIHPLLMARRPEDSAGVQFVLRKVPLVEPQTPSD